MLARMSDQARHVATLSLVEGGACDRCRRDQGGAPVPGRADRRGCRPARPGGGWASRWGALGSIGIDLEEVRRRTEESFGPGALERRERPRAWRPGRRRAAGRTLSFSTSARAALDGTPGEADRRWTHEITDGHVLLALLARDQAPAARLPRRLDVEPADARDRLEEAMAPPGRPDR